MKRKSNEFYRLRRLVTKHIPVIEDDGSQIYFKEGERPYIRIGSNSYYTQTTKNFLPALAHEFGHYLSSKSDRHPKYMNAITHACSEGWSFLTNNQKRLIFKEEKAAWEKGENFIKSKGFTVKKEFYDVKETCLKDYAQILKVSKKIKKVNWEVFFGDSSSEEAICLFAGGYSTFKQFTEDCSYSKDRKMVIRILKNKGYVKAMRGAQRALRLRGFEGYKKAYKGYRDL